MPIRRQIISALFTSVCLTACGGGSDSSPIPPTQPQASCDLTSLEQSLRQQATALKTDTDFTLLLERFDGRAFSYSRGASSAVTSYESASTSKWVSAVIILRLVDSGVLNLSDTAASRLTDWPLSTSHPLAQMTLQQLLSFTSGLTEEPLCLNLPGVDFAQCVRQGLSNNTANGRQPGTVFDYNGLHLQVAGLMAIRAAGAADWQALFRQFTQQTGLFSTARYDLPSTGNPRLAGGMHWTAQQYLDFLRALQQGKLLSAALQQQMLANQRANATVLNSPAVSGFGTDWPYGLGHWLECNNGQPNSSQCASAQRHSSPGAYGAYPLIDYQHQYLAMLAREGLLGSFVEGKAVIDALTPAIKAWADCKP
ncbi:MAG: serine hydrolase domain-containing protein [Rheinheimera sp.]|nr:serine hydrolase domain-containing protein [Rheinheimera sp.]